MDTDSQPNLAPPQTPFREAGYPNRPYPRNQLNGRADNVHREKRVEPVDGRSGNHERYVYVDFLLASEQPYKTPSGAFINPIPVRYRSYDDLPPYFDGMDVEIEGTYDESSGFFEPVTLLVVPISWRMDIGDEKKKHKKKWLRNLLISVTIIIIVVAMLFYFLVLQR